MKILIAHEKHEDRYFDVSSTEKLHRAALFLVDDRLASYYPESVQEQAHAIVRAEDGEAALRFLYARRSHEYEGFDIVSATLAIRPALEEPTAEVDR